LIFKKTIEKSEEKSPAPSPLMNLRNTIGENISNKLHLIQDQKEPENKTAISG